MKGTYFISGIDTNIGKSYATGAIAKELFEKGISVITQKLIQTGNIGISEDIELHRRIMKIPLQEVDINGLTHPIVLSYPASPHLAAQIDDQPIQFHKIEQATQKLEELYDVVLLEGAGGLMVPITKQILTIDYIAEQGYPVILVTSGRLGSINHTLLSLEALKIREIELYSVVFNRANEIDSVIANDTLNMIKSYTHQLYPNAKFEILDQIELED